MNIIKRLGVDCICGVDIKIKPGREWSVFGINEDEYVNTWLGYYGHKYYHPKHT